MSLSPVLERSSAVASRWTRSLNAGSISSVTTARPSSSLTGPMAPIVTPATRTDWPWPGCTAWALDSTASIFFGDSSMSGKRSRWLARM